MEEQALYERDLDAKCPEEGEVWSPWHNRCATQKEILLTHADWWRVPCPSKYHNAGPGESCGGQRASTCGERIAAWRKALDAGELEDLGDEGACGPRGNDDE